MSLTTILYIVLTAFAVHRVWTIWQRKGPWRRLILWIAAAIALYALLIYLVAGPASSALDHVSGDAMLVAVLAIGLPVLLSLCELGFRTIDGPFPAIVAGSTYRRKLHPWMIGAAGVVILMAVVLRVGPTSWHENLSIITFLAALFSCIVLWFLHHKARRFDYGSAAVQQNFWLHWKYSAGELNARTGLNPLAVQEAWMGPDGLLFVGDFAPWALSFYKVVGVEAVNDSHPRVNFTFKNISFGNSTSEEVFRVAIPEGKAGDLPLIERQLRTACPGVKIAL